MDAKLRSIIEEHVISEIRDAYNEDGLINCVDLQFIDFDWDLWEIVKGIIPEDDDDDYDRIMGEADDIAQIQFSTTMNKLTTALIIIDGALNITGK
jgi:hypothetical protein